MAGDDFWMALIRCMSEKGSYANGRGYWLLMSLMILFKHQSCTLAVTITPHELIQIAGEFSGVAAFHSLQLCFYPVPM